MNAKFRVLVGLISLLAMLIVSSFSPIVATTAAASSATDDDPWLGCGSINAFLANGGKPCTGTGTTFVAPIATPTCTSSSPEPAAKPAPCTCANGTDARERTFTGVCGKRYNGTHGSVWDCKLPGNWVNVIPEWGKLPFKPTWMELPSGAFGYVMALPRTGVLPGDWTQIGSFTNALGQVAVIVQATVLVTDASLQAHDKGGAFGSCQNQLLGGYGGFGDIDATIRKNCCHLPGAPAGYCPAMPGPTPQSITPEEEDLATWGISPQKARAHLLDLGYSENTWDRFLNEKGLGSHELKAWITIAKGTETRYWGEAFEAVRVSEGLSPQRH